MIRRYADAALRLAGVIAGSAVPDADGSPCWTGDDLEPAALARDEVVLVHGRLDDGLLTGRAGVALALAACGRLPGADPSWAWLARAAAAASVRTLAAALPDAALGWDCGALGVARAATVVAEATGDAGLAREASGLAGRAVATVLAADPPLPPWPDLLGGVAGVLAGVASAPLGPSDERHRAPALRRLIGRLDELAIPDADGLCWRMATSETAVVGLAHGASGIAFALLAAARRLEAGGGLRLVDDADVAARARALAGAGLRWEETLFDADLGGWPDLRVADPVPGLAWCHGAPGVGAVAALTAAREPGTRGAALAHATYLRAAASAAAHRPQPSFDATLCHGLGGVIELRLLASRAWPDAADEHLRQARQLADAILAAGDGWSCGVRDGGRTPNLLVGLAGVALTLARCADPGIAPSPADPALAA